MRYELIAGDTDVMNAMAKDGWEVVATFPNLNPQPYFFALMFINHEDEDKYDIEAVKKEVYLKRKITVKDDEYDFF